MPHHPDDRYLVTLTGDGRVAIPDPVREALGLEPGDRLVLTHQHVGTVQLMTVWWIAERMRGRCRWVGQRARSETSRRPRTLPERLLARRRREVRERQRKQRRR